MAFCTLSPSASSSFVICSTVMDFMSFGLNFTLVLKGNIATTLWDSIYSPNFGCSYKFVCEKEKTDTNIRAIDNILVFINKDFMG